MKPWEKYQDVGGPWSKYAAKPQATNPNDAIPEAAKRPTADVFGYELSGEADSGFSPAAAIIAAGRLGDRVVTGAKDAKNFAQFAINRAIGNPKHAMADLDALEATRQQQAENTRLYKPLADIHPGSAQIGEVAPLLPLGPAAQLITAALEYGTPEEKLLRVGAVAGGNALAMAAGKGKTVAANKAQSIAESVKTKAAADAAHETAQFRGEAGRSAQDLYRQLENLRDLKAGDRLTAEQAAIVSKYSDELAQKSAEKLAPSAATKEAASIAYKEAMATEPERAAAKAAEKLSSAEARSQFMARAKRYIPAAALGGITGTMLGGPPGGVVGAAGMMALRPMMHSARRYAQNPAVQYQALKPLGESKILAEIAKHPEYSGLLGYYFANQN